MQPDREKYYSTQEAARRIGLCTRSLYTYIRNGLVAPRCKREPGAVGKTWLWSDDDIRRARELRQELASWLQPGLREYVRNRQQQRDGAGGGQ